MGTEPQAAGITSFLIPHKPATSLAMGTVPYSLSQIQAQVTEWAGDSSFPEPMDRAGKSIWVFSMLWPVLGGPRAIPGSSQVLGDATPTAD